MIILNGISPKSVSPRTNPANKSITPNNLSKNILFRNTPLFKKIFKQSLLLSNYGL